MDRPEPLAPLEVAEPGPFQGWLTWAGLDPWETRTGPFHFRAEPDGIRCAFLVEQRHLNLMGAVHGGCLMTFADFALFAIAYPVIGGSPAVTVSLQGDFVAAAGEGDRIEATGEVVRAGRSLVFVRGLLHVAGRSILNFSGIIKKLGE